MKKSIIVVALLLLIIAALPIVGNSFMKKSITERLEHLSSYGIVLKNEHSNTSYLKSSRHFELYLQDAKAFSAYLESISSQQLAPYTDILLEGLTLGVDLEYSNLPFAKAVTLEMYPVALPQKTAQKLQKEDPHFFLFVEKFLQKRALLYHVEYNFINSDFKGYLKDINEHYKEQTTAMDFTLEKALFHGNGELLAPKEFTFKARSLHFSMEDGREKVLFVAEKLTTTNNFLSKNSYLSSLGVAVAKMSLEGARENVKMVVKEFHLNASSHEELQSIEMHTKTSFKEFYMHAREKEILLKKFHFDVAMSDVNKTKYMELQRLLQQMSVGRVYAQSKQIEQTLLALVSSGFKIELADFSLKTVALSTQKEYDGFQIRGEILLPKDPSLAQKMALSPLFALSALQIDTKMKFSQELYHALTQNRVMLTPLMKYAVEKNREVHFDIKLIDSKLTINGKQLY